MCGIFAYIGSGNSAKICLEGLKHLEYRGYDSAGIAGLNNGRILSCKEPGKVQVLESSVQTLEKLLDLAIGHTRWATHGAPTKINAHPQFDENNHFALVHNGIIENHEHLKAILEKKGVRFRSETDTEVLVQWIAYHYQGNLLDAVQTALKDIQGAFAIALIHKDHPDTIIAATRCNPLVIGMKSDPKEAYVSSDVTALAEKELDILYLNSDEIAVVKQDRVDVYDHSHHKVIKITERLGLENFSVTKAGYEHFMLKEIFEQPTSIRKTLSDRIDFEKMMPYFSELAGHEKEILSAEKVILIACGSSYHAACLAALMIEEFAKIPAQAEIASEFRFKQTPLSCKTLVIAISQSGETLDTIAALRHAKGQKSKILGITNVLHSVISRESDCCLQLKAGPEISVCSTKAFTSQVTLLFLFAVYLGRNKTLSHEEGKLLLSQAQSIPTLLEQVLSHDEQIRALAIKYSSFEHFIFIGRHHMYFTCLEAALKLKEITYLHAFGCAAGELKHGTLALVDPSVAVIGMCGNHQTLDKMLNNLMEVKARGATLLTVAPPGVTQKGSDDVLTLPIVIDSLASIPYSVAMQLFAYYVAKEKKREIDQPRNLAKSVTVE